MNAGDKSLRSLVRKWFGVDADLSVQIVEVGRTFPGRRRYVRIRAVATGNSSSIVFFRHVDGSWNVFPPTPKTLAMRLYQTAP